MGDIIQYPRWIGIGYQISFIDMGDTGYLRSPMDIGDFTSIRDMKYRMSPIAKGILDIQYPTYPYQIFDIQYQSHQYWILDA